MLIACPGPELGFTEMLVAAAILFLPVSFGLLTVPACLAVIRVMARRFAAPLDRGTLEQLIVVVASVAGALAAVFHADGFAAVLVGPSGGVMQSGEVLLVLIAPGPIGAIPWAAGELLAGESKRQRAALFTSIGVAYLLSVAMFALVGPQAFWAPSPAGFLTQLGSATIAGLGAAEAYFTTRGEALKPPPPEAVALVRALDDACTLPQHR